MLSLFRMKFFKIIVDLIESVYAYIVSMRMFQMTEV